jgi:membrane protease YdiL (CAAX protease family)
LFAAGPVLFLMVFASLSVAFAAAGTPAGQISNRVTAFVPHAVLFVLLCLGAGLWSMQSSVRLAWRFPARSKALLDAHIGALCGFGLAVTYLWLLAPVLESLQRSVGDFVPPGSILPVLSSSIGVFFVANVLVAPLIEETLYRGVALPLLGARFGNTVAVGVSCLAFGLLHWTGGVWYILLTGGVAGGCFASLYRWRGSIVAPFAAHLALNSVEFWYACAKGAGA